MPIGIAPTAMHSMAHADGETATAKGNKLELDINYIIICNSLPFL